MVHTDVGHVAVFNVDGTLHAIDDLCPHMSESLAQGPLDGCIVTCFAHGWRFDVRTGKSPDFEGIAVAPFAVDVADDDVYVTVHDPDLGTEEYADAHDPDDIDDPAFD